jgi:hypothetical protein
MDFGESRGTKVKRVVLISVVAALTIGAAALGYLYYSENKDKKDLAAENKELQARYEKIASKLEGQVDELTGGTTSLTGEKTTLEEQNASLKAENQEYASGMATIKAYNDVFKFYNTVLDTHDGFTGWTDAEFQTGLALAQKTGSTSFINTVNWAWYETSVPVFDRVLRYQKEIASGIEGALK